MNREKKVTSRSEDRSGPSRLISRDVACEFVAADKRKKKR